MTGPNLPLPAKVERVVEALEGAGLPCAIGGALAVYIEPRATQDIDVDADFEE